MTLERPAFNIRDYLWNGTVGLVAAAGQLVLVGFLTFFALGSGDMFRRKLVRIAGSSFEKKKITLHVLDDITSYIERYLIAQILTSALVGVATGLAFGLLGLDNAAVWGVIAAITKFDPLRWLFGRDGRSRHRSIPAVWRHSLDILGDGSLTPDSHAGRQLVAAVDHRPQLQYESRGGFYRCDLLGWLWGMWGLLLGIPIMMMAKAVCEHVEDLQLFGELLSG